MKLKHLVLDYINTVKNRACYNSYQEEYYSLDNKASELEEKIREKLEEEE